nr:unnamed protein product [Spirometra erinaceieuropaei]
MLLDSPDIESLVSWLSSWDSDSKVSDVICVDDYDSEDGSPWYQSAKRTEPNSHRSAYFDFCPSEDSSDSSASTRSWRSTAFLVLGPSGCGKTALVYALAAKLAFKVFEVNTSSCRSRKDVLSQCSALIGSQQVSKESLSTSFSSFEMAKGTLLSSQSEFHSS